MKLWPLFSLLLLIQQPILRGQGVDAFRAAERKGDVALADGLWEVAEMHFRQCLVDPSLAAEEKSHLSDAALALNPQLARGRAVFLKYSCNACHGQTAEGGMNNLNSETGGKITGLTRLNETFTADTGPIAYVY